MAIGTSYNDRGLQLASSVGRREHFTLLNNNQDILIITQTLIKGLWLTGLKVIVNVTFVCAATVPCCGEIVNSSDIKGCHQNLDRKDICLVFNV